jgi:hypothetical protein
MLTLYGKQLYWSKGLDCLFLSIFTKSVKEATNGREVASKKIQRNSTTYVSKKTSLFQTQNGESSQFPLIVIYVTLGVDLVG